MPKSVEELFDDAEQSPQQEAVESAQEAVATAEAAPEAQPSPAPDAQEAKAEKTEAPVGKDQGAPPAPEDTDGRDPAFGRLRKERNDYREQLSAEKVEKARLEERYKALEAAHKALEARASQAPQQAQPQQDRVPDRNTDPVGYAAHQAAYQASLVAQQHAENLRLNNSEDNLRDKEGDEAVDSAIGTFKQMLGENPALRQQFLAQRNPFKWMFAEVKKREAQAEIGDDPTAYRAKVEADTRAKLEAEFRAQLASQSATAEPEPVPSKTDLPPSLGRVPNAGARSVTHTGPVPIETLWG